MKFFGIPILNAVKAAVGTIQSLRTFNVEQELSGGQNVKIGIGIHTGELMLGAIGERKRMESTVISDAVNLSSRLEGLTKVYGSSIIISGETLDQIEKEKYYYRYLDTVKVQGKKTPVVIFEI